MSYIFPSSPSVNDLFTPSGGPTWKWTGSAWTVVSGTAGGGGASVTIGDSPPATPATGNMWWKSDTGDLYIRYDDTSSVQWVPASAMAGPQGLTGAPGPTGATGSTGASGATETPATLLTKLLTVDGSGSTLDADLLDGHDTAYFVPEAASDGNTYARMNAAWVQLPEIGGLATTEYTFNATTSAPPGTGTFRMNSATQTAVTAIWLHDINAVSVDTSRAMAMLRKGNTLLLQDKGNAANYQYYVVSGAITDAGTYTTIPVTWSSGGSPITAGRVMIGAFGLGISDEVVGGVITIASSAPSSPAVNDVWIDTT